MKLALSDSSKLNACRKLAGGKTKGRDPRSPSVQPTTVKGWQNGARCFPGHTGNETPLINPSLKRGGNEIGTAQKSPISSLIQLSPASSRLFEGEGEGQGQFRQKSPINSVFFGFLRFPSVFSRGGGGGVQFNQAIASGAAKLDWRLGGLKARKVIAWAGASIASGGSGNEPQTISGGLKGRNSSQAHFTLSQVPPLQGRKDLLAHFYPGAAREALHPRLSPDGLSALAGGNFTHLQPSLTIR